jgi:hypothetical protein
VNEILAKISSYNIFNYLFPGAVFTVIADRLAVMPAPKHDIVIQLLWYYFVGLVISRIGSVVLEPLLKLVRFVKYSDYSAYLRACAADPKMDTMVEVANTYRTLAAAFLLLLLSAFSVAMVSKLGFSAAWQDRSVLLLLLVLFLFSFRKQSAYVSRRVSHFGGRA